MNACEKFHGTVTSKKASGSPLRAASIQLRITNRSSGPTSLTVSARTRARTRVGWRSANTCDTSPPYEMPATCARDTPSTSSSPARSSACPSIEYGSSG